MLRAKRQISETDMRKTNHTAENSMYNGEAKPSYFFVIMIIYIILCTNLDNFTLTLLYFYTYEPKVEIYVSIIKTLQPEILNLAKCIFCMNII